MKKKDKKKAAVRKGQRALGILKEIYINKVVEEGFIERPEYGFALLMDSVDNLKISVEESSKITNELTESSNKLTRKIKFLNWLLVIIGVITVVLVSLSLYLQFFRN